MKMFYEKAEKKVLDKCKRFVEQKKDTTGDYVAYQEAMGLSIELRQSLLDSHKEFDDAIKAEKDRIDALDDSTECYVAVNGFNKANYCLRLDVEAHEVLEQLEQIEKQNRKMVVTPKRAFTL